MLKNICHSGHNVQQILSNHLCVINMLMEYDGLGYDLIDRLLKATFLELAFLKASSHHSTTGSCVILDFDALIMFRNCSEGR